MDEVLALGEAVLGGDGSVLTSYGANISDLNEAATYVNEWFNTCSP